MESQIATNDVTPEVVFFLALQLHRLIGTDSGPIQPERAQNITGFMSFLLGRGANVMTDVYLRYAINMLARAAVIDGPQATMTSENLNITVLRWSTASHPCRVV